MFRIRRIMEAAASGNRPVIEQVQALLREQFGALKEKEIASLPLKLNDPLKYAFQTRLFVAEKGPGPILGFAIFLHVPDIGFSYLDFMATSAKHMGRGIGNALYQRVREEARNLDSRALFFECLPDDPKLSPNEAIRRQNIQRLRFYEKYGAFPMEGSLYETPLSPEDTDPPLMVVDLLGKPFPDGAFLQKVIRAILERKYAHLCPREYIDKVVHSFAGEGVKLRAPRYHKVKPVDDTPALHPGRIVYLANEGHQIHHVKERGYVESPVRVQAIIRELEKVSFMEKKPITAYPDKVLLSVHDPDYVSYLKKACLSVSGTKSVYPYVFPIRNTARKPKEMTVRAGYYCIDTFTPLNANAYKAARSAVDCVMTAADMILGGEQAVYALVRPPGHHAERKVFGGFCYFANTAIAAEYLSHYGKVAVLDIDYHHGNSQQDIFYKRGDVLTVSLHGDPAFAYPYFTGFADERGEGAGYGCNLNIPLPEHLSVEDYLRQVSRALKAVRDFVPSFLVVALGLDTAKADPTGTWSLRAEDFMKLGALIGELDLPILVVQEGGYRTQTLGINARHFFTGLYKSVFAKTRPPKGQMVSKRLPDHASCQPVIRRDLRPGDNEAIRRLVRSLPHFSEEEIVIAGELAEEALAKGSRHAGYHFSLAEENGELIGYACYGPIPFTKTVYDLYWIIVKADFHRRRMGRRLLEDVEQSVLKEGGDTLYAETSSAEGYAAARAFYLKSGFVLFSEYPDFYQKGESKLVFRKMLEKGPGA